MTRTIVYQTGALQIVSLYDGHGRPTFKILDVDRYVGKTADGGYRSKTSAIRAARRLDGAALGAYQGKSTYTLTVS